MTAARVRSVLPRSLARSDGKLAQVRGFRNARACGGRTAARLRARITGDARHAPPWPRPAPRRPGSVHAFVVARSGSRREQDIVHRDTRSACGPADRRSRRRGHATPRRGTRVRLSRRCPRCSASRWRSHRHRFGIGRDPAKDSRRPCHFTSATLQSRISLRNPTGDRERVARASQPPAALPRTGFARVGGRAVSRDPGFMPRCDHGDIRMPYALLRCASAECSMRSVRRVR